MINIITITAGVMLSALLGLAMVGMLFLATIINIPTFIITMLTDRQHFRRLTEMYRSSAKYD
jgi:hypothetical protein